MCHKTTTTQTQTYCTLYNVQFCIYFLLYYSTCILLCIYYIQYPFWKSCKLYLLLLLRRMITFIILLLAKELYSNFIVFWSHKSNFVMKNPTFFYLYDPLSYGTFVDEKDSFIFLGNFGFFTSIFVVLFACSKTKCVARDRRKGSLFCIIVDSLEANIILTYRLLCSLSRENKEKCE